MAGRRIAATILGAILAVAFIAGIALYRGMEAGEQALIPWGMMVVGYVFFALASGGVFDSMAIRLLRGSREAEEHAGLLAWSSLALLIPGVILVFSDVLHPLAAPYFYLSFNPESRIAWNAVLYLLYGAGLLLFIILLHRRGRVDGLVRRVAMATLAFSLLLEANLGMAYGVNVAVPAWYVSMAPILFIAASLAIGSGFTILTLKLAQAGRALIGEYAEELRYTVLAMAFTVGWSLIGMAAWGEAKTAALEILAGWAAPAFWIGFALTGVVIPLALARRSPQAAGALAILGVAVYLAIPFNYVPQEVRLDSNPLYGLLAEAGPVEASLQGYLVNPETLAFIGGLGVWLLLLIHRERLAKLAKLLG